MYSDVEYLHKYMVDGGNTFLIIGLGIYGKDLVMDYNWRHQYKPICNVIQIHMSADRYICRYVCTGV
jgi:hypothetical protein